MKVSELIGKGKCSMRATLRYEGGMTCSNERYAKASLLKQIFTEKIDSLRDLEDIDYSYLDKMFPGVIFETKREKKKYIENTLEKIEKVTTRMKGVLDKKLIQKINDTVEFKGVEFEVSADIALEDDSSIELFFISDSKAKWKTFGRSENTKAENSLELFFLTLLGRKMRPTKKVVKATYIYLKEDIDSSNFLVSMYPISSRVSDFSKKVGELLSLNKYEKSCSTSSCIFCEFKNLCEYKHNLEILPDNEDISVEDATVEELPFINFTYEQEDVINFVKGIGVINAVPGAGKTATMAKRVDNLINTHGVDPKDILVISFSTRSVEEFYLKLKKNHGITEFENVFTFNGFGDENIAKNYSYFGYTKKPRLFSNAVEKLDLIKEIVDISEEITEINEISEIYNTSGCLISSVDYLNPFQRIGNKKTGIVFKMEKIFDYIKSKGVNYKKNEFIIEESFRLEDEVMKDQHLTDDKKMHIIKLYEEFLDKVYDMYTAYENLLRKRGFYDYLDQVNYLAYSLNHPRINSFNNYKHIICDEFQDSNSLGMYVLKRLTLNENFESLVVVGDINQSIYGFMGTTPENLARFRDKFENEVVKSFDLSYTFRVPKTIAEKANMLMTDSYNVNYNQMNAVKTEGTVSTFANKEAMVDSIKEMINKGEDVGIITRNNMDLNDFIDIMVENNIPYVVKSNLDILKKSKVRALLPFANFVKSPSSNTLDLAKYLQVSDNEEFVKHFKKATFNKYINDKLEQFLVLSSGKNARELLKIYFDMLDEVAEKDYMIEVFVEHLKKQKFKSIYDAHDYCKKLDIYGVAIKAPENPIECSVTLTTGHSSKGREFDNVIVDISTFAAKTEEDRRLFYVAITRAKKNLYLINMDRKSSKKDCSKYLAAMGLKN